MGTRGVRLGVVDKQQLGPEWGLAWEPAVGEKKRSCLTLYKVRLVYSSKEHYKSGQLASNVKRVRLVVENWESEEDLLVHGCKCLIDDYVRRVNDHFIVAAASFQSDVPAVNSVSNTQGDAHALKYDESSYLRDGRCNADSHNSITSAHLLRSRSPPDDACTTAAGRLRHEVKSESEAQLLSSAEESECDILAGTPTFRPPLLKFNSTHDGATKLNLHSANL